MIAVSPETIRAYDRRMERAGVNESERCSYRKWVGFYLDFCGEYAHPPRSEQGIGPLL